MPDTPDQPVPPRRGLSRRELLRDGIGVGVLGALAGGKVAGASALSPAAAAKRSGALGLGPGGALRAPGHRPYPHLPEGADTIPQIEHVVVLMMENHSFDDHLGMLGRGDGLTIGPNGRPINYNPLSSGGFTESFHLPSTANPDPSNISQSWDQSHLCWDYGTNMGFANHCGPASLGYLTGDDFPFYYGMASQFPIGDRYFCSVMAQTYPNRRFLIAGTALGDVSTNSSGISATDAPNGVIFDRFDANNISWRDYYPDVPTCALFLPTFLNNENTGRLGHIADFLADAAAGTLPQFSIVDPYITYSEENGDMSIGEAFAARIIDAVITGPKWSSTALFWVYDEHGGWYDHVPPRPAVRPDDVPPEITVPPDQPGAYDYTGFRVPSAVVSPFAKRDHVSHFVYDHTSILKFLETKWNLPALTYRDANAHNMLDFFDLDCETPPFLEPPKLPAPLNPFVGALPPGSGSPGFHPIATPVNADTLPPAQFHLDKLPKGTQALLAAHKRKYDRVPHGPEKPSGGCAAPARADVATTATRRPRQGAMHRCDQCRTPINGAGPAVAFATANPRTASFESIVDASPVAAHTLEHLRCYVRRFGLRALADLLHAPKAAVNA